MPERLQLRIGDRSRLKARGEVERWTCDHPEVVSVSDVDIVHGLPGGELHARKAGQARVQGIGPDNTVRIVVDVIVEAGSPAITLAVGASGQLPLPDGITRCAAAQTQVARVDNHGKVHALGPGIAKVVCTGPGGVEAEFQVRVTGVLEIEAGRSLSLADRVSVPVSRWRTGSSSVAGIDARGTLKAGPDARTTPIFLTLESGEEFSFDLRILRSDPGTSPERRPEAAGAATPTVPTPPLAPPETTRPRSEEPPTVTPPVAPEAFQQQEVYRHLASFESMLEQRRWEDADVMLLGADVAASGYEQLKEVVREARKRLTKAKQDWVQVQYANLTAALRQHDYQKLRELAAAASFPPDSGDVTASILGLSERLEAMQDTELPLENRLRGLQEAASTAWQAAASHDMTFLLGELAEVFADWSIEEAAPEMVDIIAPEVERGIPTADRNRIIAALAKLDEAGIQALLERLVRAAGATRKWALYALCEIGMGKSAGTLAAFYGSQDTASRQSMVESLVSLADQCPEDFLSVIAGVLQRLPVDRRLADALTRAFGKDKTERLACSVWARSRLSSARTVLERMFKYRPDSLR